MLVLAGFAQKEIVRYLEMLGERGIKPKNLPPSEDIKKLERRVKKQEKKIVEQSGRLPDVYARCLDEMDYDNFKG